MLASVAKLVGKSLAEIRRRHHAPVVQVSDRRVFIIRITLASSA